MLYFPDLLLKWSKRTDLTLPVRLQEVLVYSHNISILLFHPDVTSLILVASGTFSVDCLRKE